MKNQAPNTGKRDNDKISATEKANHKAFKNSKGPLDALEKEGKKRWKADDVHDTNKTQIKVRITK